ncbi:MAG TPA: ATP-binding protein, partial [Chloroflexota bacterium]|nr:ATP-binding protein [Chloroflexota bacterium]
TGGPIEVGVDREDEDAVISVTRHGSHIPPERQLHLFEPFYESIPPGAPGYAGVASVGLYLSKLIAEAHGGRIGLAVGPGDRETVWFSLPLAGPADG